MWILRFHLLEPKDYNKVNRICKKYGFSSRSHAAIIYGKAAVKHATQKHSWRSLGNEFHLDHGSLCKFYKSAQESGLLREIFYIFLERKIALYIGENREVSKELLDNSREIYDLTKKEFENMLEGL